MKCSLIILGCAVLALTSACKLEINTPASGVVETDSGNYNCQSGEKCVINIEDTNFDESFTARGNAGYFFLSWKDIEGGFCRWSVRPCRLSTKDFGGIDVLLETLSSDRTFYLEPQFQLGECEDRSDSWTELINGENTTFKAAAKACTDYTGTIQPHGIAHLWQNDVLVSESHWLLGRLHGPETEWSSNGNLIFRYKWRYGLKEGAQRKYYPDGSLWRYEEFKKGTWHGESRNYNEQGIITSIQTLFENIMHGPEKYFRDNGQIYLKRTYKLGKKQGVEKHFFDDGSVKELRTYRNGELAGPFEVYNESGEIVDSGTFPLFRVKNNGIVEDTTTGLKWLKNANAFKTMCDKGNRLAVSFLPADAMSSSEICNDNGRMTWNDANEWVAWLNENKFKGFSDWRMPETDINSTCSRGLCINSDLSSLYHMSLNNPGDHYTRCTTCLRNSGPFNSIQASIYWSGTLHPVWKDAFFFSFTYGFQDSDNFENRFYVWPVRN